MLKALLVALRHAYHFCKTSEMGPEETKETKENETPTSYPATTKLGTKPSESLLHDRTM